MLSLIALSIVARTSVRQDSPTCLEPADVAPLLESAGYAFDEVIVRSGCGTLSRRGAQVSVGIATSGKSREQGQVQRVVGLQLQIEIPISEDVPLSEAKRPFSSFIPTPDLFAIPHLGRTVTLIQDIDLRSASDSMSVRKALDHFWDQGSTYAALHRGRFAVAQKLDWTKARFSDDLVIDRGDKISFERVAAAWGMRIVPYGNPHYRFDAVALDLGGAYVSVSVGPFGNEPHNGGFTLDGMVTLPPHVEPRAWREANAMKLPITGVFTTNPWEFFVWRNVDMTKGVRLGDLRRRIQAFAGDVRALQKSIDTTL